MKRKPLILLTAALVLLGLVTVAATTAPENLPRALNAQRRMVAQHPTDAAAWNDLGNLLVLGEFLDEAEDAYRRAVELAPEAPALHFNLGLLLQEEGKLRQAARAYRRVVELEPGNAWAHYQLGAIYEARQEAEKAIASYGRALRLDPSLAFPDVNPHVIESELLTEAMLRGYRAGLVQPQAPRIYQQPGRITALLLTPSDVEPAVEEGSMDEPMEGQMAQEKAMAPQPQESAAGAAGPQAAARGDEADRRVLREQDLDDRPANQATPQGRGGYRPPPRSTTGRTPSTVRTWQPPTPTPTPPAQGDSSNRRGIGPTAVLGGTVTGTAVQGQPTAPPSGSTGSTQTPPRTRRTPTGVNSTGSLDVYLAPAAERRG